MLSKITGISFTCARLVSYFFKYFCAIFRVQDSCLLNPVSGAGVHPHRYTTEASSGGFCQVKGCVLDPNHTGSGSLYPFPKKTKPDLDPTLR